MADRLAGIEGAMFRHSCVAPGIDPVERFFSGRSERFHFRTRPKQRMRREPLMNAMNRIMLTGIAILGSINATAPAVAAHRHASRYVQSPAEQHWTGGGAHVEEVVPNTGAARAGIRPGDVIVGVNGSPVSGYSDIDSHVAASGGRALSLDIVRGGRRLRVKASTAPLLTQNWYGNIEHRRVLGLAHTEARWVLMPCALDPDCE